MFTAAFWKDTIERVVSAFVTSLLGVFGTAQVADLHAVQWKQALIAAGVIAGLTLLKCLGAGTGVVGEKGSPSLVAPVADPAAGERLIDPAGHVELKKVSAGYPGGQIGPQAAPTTRATGAPKMGGDVAPHD